MFHTHFVTSLDHVMVKRSRSSPCRAPAQPDYDDTGPLDAWRDLEDERRCASSSISPGIEAMLEARLARALGSLVTFEHCNYLSYVVLRYVTHAWYVPR